MNAKNALVYGFAGFAAWYAWRSMKGTSAGSAGGIFDILRSQRKDSGANLYQNTDKVTEVLNSGAPYSNGWRYFTDGTAIDPQGNYYSNGALIWSPA